MIIDNKYEVILKINNFDFNSTENHQISTMDELERVLIGGKIRKEMEISEKDKLKVCIDEILVNPILIESIEIVMNSISVNEIAVILKNILRNDIKENDFNFYKEIHKIKKSHKCTNSDLHCLKKNIYHAIEKHYSQDSILRIIKFRFNKSKIIKKALYKTLDTVTYKLKRTNELMLKDSIQLIKSNI